MNIQVKYTHSLHTSDLRDDELHHNTDAIAAVSLGATEFGAALLRAKINQRITEKLLVEWRKMVAKRGKRNKWTNCESVADISLWYFMDDTCQACNGRGAMLIDDTPVLGRTCQVCEGAGKKPMRFERDVQDACEHCVEWLNRIYSAAGKAASDKIGK